MNWIDEQYPGLAATGYDITSDPTDEYNCIAWAAGASDAWWSHAPGYEWPIGDRSSSPKCLEAVFASLGYEPCASAEPESGFEKVVLYAKDGRWSHAARLLPDGNWTSKLGPDEDISHPTPEGLCGSGDTYGEIHTVMRRPTMEGQDKKRSGGNERPISLHGLELEEALRGAMQAEPPESEEPDAKPDKGEGSTQTDD